MSGEQCAQIIDKNEFLNDVLEGLSAPRKTLPCKYFYDDLGSQLFEQICELDEYYLTRTECGILEQYGDQIVDGCDDDVSVIEPGAGAGRKVAILLNALGGGRCFVPLEISAEALHMTGDYLSDVFPALSIRPIHGDFTNPVDVTLAAKEIGNGPRLVFFPGSTLGNFERPDAVSVLVNLRRLMGSNGAIIIGLDLVKDESRLLAAYNDPGGVTAAFNKNLLCRINKELGADFDCEYGFDHQAIYNRDQQRIEMHLCSTRSQAVTIDGQSIAFERGETIHTENSHKYSMESVDLLCRKARLRIDDYWTDDDEAFAVFRLSHESD